MIQDEVVFCDGDGMVLDFIGHYYKATRQTEEGRMSCISINDTLERCVICGAPHRQNQYNNRGNIEYCIINAHDSFGWRENFHIPILRWNNIIGGWHYNTDCGNEVRLTLIDYNATESHCRFIPNIRCEPSIIRLGEENFIAIKYTNPLGKVVERIFNLYIKGNADADAITTIRNTEKINLYKEGDIP